MPENIRSLIVIVFLGLIGFYFAKKISLEELTDKNIKLLRNVWLAVVITGFLSYNFWVFLLLSSIFITKITKSEPNKIAVFFILAFAMPNLSSQISGLGIINYLITFTYPRFISVLILLPAAIFISKKNEIKFFSLWSDKFLLMYILISSLAILRHTTFTDALRGWFYAYTDIFLPYYVASRGIKNISEMNHALFAIVSIAIITSLFAIFEYSKSWLLFSSLGGALGVSNDMGGYLLREGGVRSVATMAHALILGTFLGVTINYNFYFANVNIVSSKYYKKIVALILILGVFVTISRGPWLATTLSFILFLLLDKKPFKKLAVFLIIATIVFAGLSASPKGEKFIKILPWINSENPNSYEQFNVEYREKLFENSIIVINRSPFFGSSDYIEEPEMQELIQGEGIIDIVNSYIGVALNIGYIGLTMFVGVFFSVLYGIKLKMKKIKYKSNSLHTLGASLMSAILCYMLCITAVSTIGAMQFICWSMLGLGVSYSSVVNNFLKSQANNKII